MMTLRAWIALFALGAGTANAQEAAKVPAPSSARSTYVSPFEHYRAFVDEPVQSWRDANETVRKIGGWQAYGRESQQELQAPARSDPPEKSTAPAAPANSPHSHHGGRR
jgi:hypothetical protein